MSTVVGGLTGLFGAVLALAPFGVAFKLNSTSLALLATTLSAPFCEFVSGYPIVGQLAWAALIGNILAACFMRRRRDVAFAALTPFAAICVFLAVLAVRGITLAHR